MFWRNYSNWRTHCILLLSDQSNLWIKPTENFARISQAGVEDLVYPIQADARSLPFAEAYFDAILCTDAYIYFGTDDLYLEYLHLQAARHPPLTRKVASQSNRFTCKRFYK